MEYNFKKRQKKKEINKKICLLKVTILYGGLRNSLSSGNTDGTNKYNHCINQEAT